MFDLRLTDEQDALVATARDFAKKEIIPVAGHLDEEGKFPSEICNKAFHLGLMNLEVPERKLLTFVLFGLPEIEQYLKLDPPLHQRLHSWRSGCCRGCWL